MSGVLKNKIFLQVLMIFSFLLVFIPYFFDIPMLSYYSTKLIVITSIANAFTITLAIYSQFKRNVTFIQRRKQMWIFKAYMLITIVLMMLFAFVSQTSGPYQWVITSVIAPLSSVNYCILVFYLASTAARAFKAKNSKALILLVMGFIVLLYQAPLTGSLFPQITPVATFITNTIVVSAARMFLISTTVGALVFGIRVLMGKESNILGMIREEGNE